MLCHVLKVFPTKISFPALGKTHPVVVDIRYDVPGKSFRIGPGPDLSLFEHIAGNCDGLSDFGNAVPACASVRADRDGGRLLLAYWGAMQFITVDGYGGGNYTPDGNLAEWVDRTVLGRFRDAAVVENGQIVFAESYRYTWILSSLNFGVTVLTGVFAGYILKSGMDGSTNGNGC